MRFSLARVLAWLREGYPQGVPGEDYIALFGVLQRHLTDAEIVKVGEAIRAANGDEPISEDEIRRRIARHLHGHASDQDVRRVAARLAQGGWPLAGDIDLPDDDLPDDLPDNAEATPSRARSTAPLTAPSTEATTPVPAMDSETATR